MAMKSVFLFLAITLFTRPHEALRMEQIGCYKDGPERDLPYLARDGHVTPMICKNLCEELKYAYFGLQFKYQCWCGNEYGQYGIAPEHECNWKCSGDKNTLCGGRLRNLIYKTGIKSPELGMRLLGCFKDSLSRDLPHWALKGEVTPTICYNLCNELKYAYAGVQFKDECFCGNSYGKYGNVSIQECNLTCKVEESTYCGGYRRNRIYTAHSTTNALGMEQIGCYMDDPERDLPYLARDGHMTPMICKNLCEKLKYAYFGLQLKYRCWCGNEYGQYGIAPEHECSWKCSGDENYLCGGFYRNIIYKIGIKSPELGMRLLGCFKDSRNRDLPYRVLTGVVSPTICYELCKELKFAYAGVQVSDTCLCGNSYGQYGNLPIQYCDQACKPDYYTSCGGIWTNRIYTADATTNGLGMRLLGCFKDNNNSRDLPHLALRGDVTPTICYNLCKKLKYAYAGVQAEDECWYGNSYGQYGNVSIQECNQPCTGELNTYCGGSSRNRIYTVDLTSYTPPVPPMMEYVGCFIHGDFYHVLNEEEDAMSPAICYHLCKQRKHRYFGLHASNKCWCGDSYGEFGSVPDFQCNLRCKGNEDFWCGGLLRNRVYKTGLP